MAFQKDPNELGVIWLESGKGRGEGQIFMGGRAFPVPPQGVTVDLIPFSYTSKQDGTEKRGLRVIKVPTHQQQQPENVPSYDDLDKVPF